MNPLWFIALGVLWFVLAAFIWALCVYAAREEAEAARPPASGTPWVHALRPSPVPACRAPDRECPRWTSCARHNECEWESRETAAQNRPGTIS